MPTMSCTKFNFHIIQCFFLITFIFFYWSNQVCIAQNGEEINKDDPGVIIPGVMVTGREKPYEPETGKRIFWTPLRLGIYEGICLPAAVNVCPLNLCIGENPMKPNLENMFGLSIGGMYSVKNLYGMMFSIMGVGGANNNYGLVFVPGIGITKNNYGFNLGCLGGVVKEKNCGVTFGILGAGGKENQGLAAGGIGAGTIKGSNHGLLIGPVFTLTNENHFFQFGLFNWANKGDGLQLGLLNRNPDGFLPWFPFINF